MRIFRSSLMRAARHRWPRIKRILPWLVLAIVAALIVYFGRSVDWPQVWQAMRRIPASAILLAAAMAAAGYTAYGALDLLGKRYTRHGVAWTKVMGIALVSYALNLNLGVLVGGLGARLRLYARLGCRKSVATRVALFSAVSNWVGYGWVAGAVFASGAVPVPADWDIGRGVLRLLGVAMLALAFAYVWMCARAKRRSATLMGHRVTLPGTRLAIQQCVTAAASWLIMGGIMYVLLQGKAPFLAVLGILLCTSFAALITRVPGGLGTTEAIFVAALSPSLPAAEVLGAALAYRAVYALGPLCLAVVAFTLFEARTALSRRRAPAPTTQAPPSP